MIDSASDSHDPLDLATPAQRDWLALQFGMFVHFGINTFNDCEWSHGDLDPATFDPKAFNPKQWCAAAKTAGIKYLLVVTKHIDGFCLWPSQFTDYSVAASPFKKDVLDEVARACAESDIKLAFYYALWDGHEPSYGDDRAYARYVKGQLSELLTRYGEVVSLWFDGGWKKGGVDWQDHRAWHWLDLYEHIKSIQPNCLVGNNGTTKRKGEIVTWPCDYRIFEKGLPGEDDRLVYDCDGEVFLPGECDDTLSAGGDGKGMFASGKWFWHANDDTAKQAEWVAEQLRTANARHANYVINVGPTDQGLLREIDVARLAEVGKLRGVS